MKNYTKKKCKECGTYFSVRRSKNNQVYCSRECYHKTRIGITTADRVNVICEYCGSEFQIIKSWFIKDGRRFCNMTCQRNSQQKKKETDMELLGNNRAPYDTIGSKLKKYGITIGDYGRMFSEQGGVCAICGLPQKNGDNLCIDHDHDTGVVRGLLCRTCNSGMGQLRDDTRLLLRAIEYLERERG